MEAVDKLGDKLGLGFPVAEAKLWNSLPLPLRYLFFGTGWKYSYFAAAMTLSDYVWHSSDFAVMFYQYSGPCSSF